MDRREVKRWELGEGALPLHSWLTLGETEAGRWYVRLNRPGADRYEEYASQTDAERVAEAVRAATPGWGDAQWEKRDPRA